MFKRARIEYEPIAAINVTAAHLADVQAACRSTADTTLVGAKHTYIASIDASVSLTQTEISGPPTDMTAVVHMTKDSIMDSAMRRAFDATRRLRLRCYNDAVTVQKTDLAAQLLPPGKTKDPTPSADATAITADKAPVGAPMPPADTTEITADMEGAVWVHDGYHLQGEYANKVIRIGDGHQAAPPAFEPSGEIPTRTDVLECLNGYMPLSQPPTSLPLPSHDFSAAAKAVASAAANAWATTSKAPPSSAPEVSRALLRSAAEASGCASMAATTRTSTLR